MKPTNLQNAPADPRLLAVLERIAARLDDLHRVVASQVAVVAEPSNGASVKPARRSRVDDREKLLAGVDVAALLDVNVRTLRRMRAEGRGPKPVRVGSRDRWQREVVQAWLDRRAK